jgi:hypothetical protein
MSFTNPQRKIQKGLEESNLESKGGQDDALPHFFHRIHAFLDREFPDNWVGRDPLVLQI